MLPQAGDPYISLRALLDAGELVPARGWLEQRVVDHPLELSAWDYLGFVAYFGGDYARASEACETALRLKPQHAYALKGLGLCRVKQGAIAEGLALLEQAIQSRPSFADPYHDRIVVLVDCGRLKEAAAALEAAKCALPGHAYWRALDRLLRQRTAAARG